MCSSFNKSVKNDANHYILGSLVTSTGFSSNYKLQIHIIIYINLLV